MSEMNNLQKLQEKVENRSMLQFGLSQLHAHIRFFECIIHISYRLDFKKWKATSNDGTKELLNKRKSTVQEKFRNRLGLLVDIPKPGYGTTNDGNTARRFFENPKEGASITGVSEDLITRFRNILMTISCGHEVHIENFDKYCRSTAELFIDLYPWFYMPGTKFADNTECRFTHL